MKFTIKKVPLTIEQKRERVEFYNQYEELDHVDVEEFIKKDIYDEYIDFKCLDCGAEHELEADIVLELFNPKYEDYPMLFCNDCNTGRFVPLDIYNLIKAKKIKDPK